MKIISALLISLILSFGAKAQPKLEKVYCSKDPLVGLCIKLQSENKTTMQVWDCLIAFKAIGDYSQNSDSLNINLTALENYTTQTSLNLVSIENLEATDGDMLNIVVSIRSKERNDPIPFSEIFLTDAPSFEASTKTNSFNTDQMGNAYLKVPKDSATYFISTGYFAEYWQFFPFLANTNQEIKISLGDLFQIPKLPLEFNFIILEKSKKKILVKDLNTNKETWLIKSKRFN